MLDSVLFARDKWLRPGGLMLPNKAEMFMAVLDDEAYYKKKLVELYLSRTIGTVSMALA